MRSILTFIIAAISISCNNKSGIKDTISNSDSAFINFYKADTVETVSVFRNKKYIEQLAFFIDASPANTAECGTDGSIYFFKNNAVIQQVDFYRYGNECKYFSFKFKGKAYNTKLSPEAEMFLDNEARNNFWKPGSFSTAEQH